MPDGRHQHLGCPCGAGVRCTGPGLWKARQYCQRQRDRVHQPAILKWANDNNVEWHYIDPGKPQQNAFIESFNGSLRDELLNEEMFDNLDDVRRKLALWRYNYNNVRPHSSLGNQTPAEARRTLEQFEGSAPGALAQNETEDYENQTRRLSL